jgi:hypothetical protein
MLVLGYLLFCHKVGDLICSIDTHFQKIHTLKLGRLPIDKVVIDFKYMDNINPACEKFVTSQT